MAENEKIFILEWGYLAVKLVYGAFDENGNTKIVDAKSIKNNGYSLDSEKDITKVSELLSELLEYYEKKHLLKIQTIYLLYSGSGCVVRNVKEKEKYEAFLEQKDRSISKLKKLPDHELPLHCEIFSVFDKFSKTSQTEGIVFAVHSNERHIIQKALLEKECFIEGFVPLANLMRSGVDQVFLALGHRRSILFSSFGNKLASYSEFDFSLNSIRDELVDKINLEKEQALKLIKWVINPPSIDDEAYYKDVDASLFRSEEFAKTRNLIGDDLENFAITVRQHLEDCGVWDQGIKNLVLLGEGSALISRYTFIREIIPFSFQMLNNKYPEFFFDKSSIEEFLVLFHLLPTCYKNRLELRKKIERSQKKFSLSEWSRRLLGR
jgi:hypothetical protein